MVVPAEYAAAYPLKFGIAKVGTKRTNWLIYRLSFVLPTDPQLHGLGIYFISEEMLYQAPNKSKQHPCIGYQLT